MRHTLVQAFKRSLRRFATSDPGDSHRRISHRRLQCEPLEDRRLLSIAASISGHAYCDINDDGVRDADEIGIPGVLVTLTGADDQGRFVEVSRLTADDGSYLFEDLEPGTYAIDESQPDAFRDGKDTLGSLDGKLSNDRFSNIVLTADAEATGYNFGEGRLRPQFATLQMLLASRPPADQYIRETVADGEEQAGRGKLAELIRQGGTAVPNEVLDKTPIALNDTYTLAEDAVVTRTAEEGVLANDLDVARNPMLDSIDTSDYVALTVAGPSHGQVVLGDDGSFTYTPEDDYSGTDSFTYVLANGILDSNEATVTLIVTPINDPPAAAGDAYSIGEDGILTIDAANGVLANDTDVEDDTLTAILVTGPQHGTLALNAAGSFTYTPAANYSGTDSFSYKANDGSADSNTATVTITVNSVNDVPVANGDAYAVNEDTELVVNAANGLLANDTDVEGSPLTAILVAGPQHGSLTPDAAGSFTYTPAADYFGSDSFTYKANDGSADSNTATVTITVNGVNDVPAAEADSYQVIEDDTLTVTVAQGVLANDTDVEADTLTAIVVTDPQHGSLTLAAAGSFTYTPAANYFGTDSFTYKANDGSADSNATTVTITISGVNDVPAAAADSYELDEDGLLTVTAAEGVLANDTDVEGNPLTAILVAGPQHGTLSLDADGSFVYTPAADFHGADAFTYKVNDGFEDSNEATVTITVHPVDDVPVAANDGYGVFPDGVLTVDAAAGLLANDTEADGDPLTASVATQPSHGALSLDADGAFTYTPEAGFHGVDSFTYRANDGLTDSNEATVTILVNHAPEAADDAYEVDEGQALTVVVADGVLANDNDADADPLTAILVSDPFHGTVVLGADGSFTYTPEENYFGTDAFTYAADDGFEDSNQATVTITVHLVNDVPAAADDAYEVDEDQALTVVVADGVLANDSDADADPLTAILVSDPSHGTAVLGADGSLAYTPEENYFGTDAFTYVANDGFGDSNEATVTITIHPINDAPVAVDDAYEVGEDGTLVITAAEGVLANDIDADSDPLVAILDVAPQHGTLQQFESDGSFEYVPPADFNGTDTFVYAINDGSLGFELATVTITVNAVNDPPVAQAQDVTTGQDVPLQITLAGDDGDPETGQTLSFALGDGPMHGTLSGFDPVAGTVTYTPAAGYVGQDVFTFTVNDGELDSTEAHVIIDVTDVNDPPDAVDDAVTTEEDIPVVIDVLSNDTDADPQDVLTVTAVTQGGHGTVTINANDTVRYAPQDGFDGSDSFTYTISDGHGAADTATVSVTVTPAANVPLIDLGDHILLPETPDQQIQIWVSGGQPVEGLDFNIQVADGGPEAVEWELIDPPGILGPIITDVDLITGTIFETNNMGHMSTYVNDVIPQFFDVGIVTQAGSVLADGLLATVTIDTMGFSSGTWELHAEDTLAGPSQFNWTDPLNPTNVIAMDARVRSGSITIFEGNLPPVAADDQATTEEDVAVIIDVLANDTDINPGDTLSISAVTQGTHGQVTINNDDTITYTPGAGFVGADQFTYTISDGQGGTDTATVDLDVTPAPVPPLIQVGSHVLLPDTPGQQIEVWVSGGQLVQGLDFLIQVADGGPEAASAGFVDPPGIDGPHVTDIDLVTGTIFQDNNLGQVNSDAHLTYPQFFAASIIAASGTVSADGLLGTVTIDTTGFSSGTWELVMTDTLAGKSDFVAPGVEIENGSITINAVGTAPTFQTIADVTLLGGSPLLIPLDGFDADGQALSYTVTSSNPSLVAASVPQGNRSMRISVAGYGDMVLELHEHLVPEVTQPIIDLAEDGFYDGLIFHRVIDEFMIQGGNPAYTGGDPSAAADFDDRFHVDLQHNCPGVLSMAKAGDDTNSSQFFITEVPTRHLDFNHSVFGLLVEGENVREAISSVPLGLENRPVTNVVMQSVEIFLDQENGVLMLKAPEGASGEADVTVTVTDEDSLQYQQTFHVTVEPDPYNGGPFLEPIPEIQTAVDTPAVFQLSAIDVEGDAVSFEALKMGSVDYTFDVDSQTGQVTVTPPTGFTGTMEILVGVTAATSSNTQDPYDSQVVEITVAQASQALVDAVLEAEEDWLSY